jgi:hypothetical protein
MSYVTFGTAAREARSSVSSLGTNSEFARRPRKTKEKLFELAGRRTLRIQCYQSSSPALNVQTKTLVSIRSVTLFGKKLIYSFLKIFICTL